MLKDILLRLVNGELSVDDAADEINLWRVRELGDNVKFDADREARAGVPEAVYSLGKSDEDLLNIINNIDFMNNLMITKIDETRYKRIRNKINEDVLKKSEFYSEASILTINKSSVKPSKGKVGIITAGTADIPIAEEAKITVQQAGYKTLPTYDVGVAGIHRLVDKITYLLEEKVDVIIALAGMEGALPSVVAGLVDIPVIAVPTSTGYGVGEKGFLALFSMLQSCSPGIATMNIDNGYGAGVYAITILKQIEKRIKEKGDE